MEGSHPTFEGDSKVLQDVTPTRGGVAASMAAASATPRRSVVDHRRVVVRRLLARGLSPQALEQILPGWLALLQQGPTTAVDGGRTGR